MLFLIVDQGGRFDAVTLELKLNPGRCLPGECSRCRGPEVGGTLLEQNREWGRTVEQEAGSWCGA